VVESAENWTCPDTESGVVVTFVVKKSILVTGFDLMSKGDGELKVYHREGNRTDLKDPTMW